MNYAEITSETQKHRVLILGRFSGRRLEVLKGIKKHLDKHPNHYVAELFVYRKPEGCDWSRRSSDSLPCHDSSSPT